MEYWSTLCTLEVKIFRGLGFSCCMMRKYCSNYLIIESLRRLGTPPQWRSAFGAETNPVRVDPVHRTLGNVQGRSMRIVMHLNRLRWVSAFGITRCLRGCLHSLVFLSALYRSEVILTIVVKQLFRTTLFESLVG